MGDKRKMIIEVVGKEIEKIKGDFESYLNGLNMVGEISYSQYSELYDEGTKQIQRAYELGKSELEKENAELKSENQKWKDEWQEQVQKATDEGYARTLQTIQLSKAKELLERLLITSCNSDVLNLLPNCSEVLRVRVEAEQFLNSEVEK